MSQNYYNINHSTVLNGINNKLFLNFNEYCNFDLEKIDLEVCLALSKLNLNKYPMVNGVIPEFLQNKDYPMIFENNVDCYFDTIDSSVLDNLTHMEARKYLFFRKKITIPWFFILDLKSNNFSTKDKDNYPWSENSNLTPYLKECILRMPFSEIGRVVIYGSWPLAIVPCHRDSSPTKNFPHHINFNPGGYRPVFVFDPINNHKHFLPSNYQFYAYNTTDYHGVDSLPYFSYTVRVDGIYNSTVTF